MKTLQICDVPEGDCCRKPPHSTATRVLRGQGENKNKITSLSSVELSDGDTGERSPPPKLDRSIGDR